MTELTQDYVRSLFDYRDGELYWKIPKGKMKIGDRTGNVVIGGYRQIMINGKNYKTHRLIFLWHHGYLSDLLDHIDRDPLNNNILNLREVTRSQNLMNQKKRKFHNGKPTSSKFKGVTWFKRDKKWQSVIGIDGKTKYLGRFTSEIEAALAYDRMVIKYHGKYATTNKSLGLL